ncbi:pyridoxal phosphate-dependent aminotransferase [Candidatus Clostridium radicumherbarum]|uniref:Pyridoxal phosphate-dependent aminotransferase n=1 Tax=Candidatus Clostridium radicumherbarum TaxID=3381662 RepID=A0ABW8TTV9_9CLOT
MIHGGDIYSEGLLKGIELIDFSSNINPLGVPKVFIDNINEAIKCMERYPDIKYREVFNCLKNYTGINEEHFVLGNGAAEIIDLVISCLKSILIVVPSFAEYEADAKKWECEIENSYLKEDMDFDYEDILKKLKNTEALIIGNPNNPNGNIINKTKFKAILDYAEREGKTVIIDEAFIEFTGNANYSFSEEIKEYDCIFIIRALTKFFAMPGVRFGYGMSKNKSLLELIKQKQNPWNINCFAELAVKYVLRDEEYIKKSLQWIEIERSYFTLNLKKLAFVDVIYNSFSNYLLCKLKGITENELYNYCMKKGIVIRKAGSFKGLNESYVRLAIKDRNLNDKLLQILMQIKL